MESNVVLSWSRRRGVTTTITPQLQIVDSLFDPTGATPNQLRLYEPPERDGVRSEIFSLSATQITQGCSLSNSCCVIATNAGLLHAVVFREVLPPDARLDESYEAQHGILGDPGGIELPPSLALVRPLGALEISVTGSVSLAAVFGEGDTQSSSPNHGAARGLRGNCANHVVARVSACHQGKAVIVTLSDGRSAVLPTAARRVGRGPADARFVRMAQASARVWPGGSSIVEAPAVREVGLLDSRGAGRASMDVDGRASMDADAAPSTTDTEDGSGHEGAAPIRYNATLNSSVSFGAASGGGGAQSRSIAGGSEPVYVSTGVALGDWARQSDTYEAGARGTMGSKEQERKPLGDGQPVVSLSGGCVGLLPGSIPRLIVHRSEASSRSEAASRDTSRNATCGVLAADVPLTEAIQWVSPFVISRRGSARSGAIGADRSVLAVHRIVVRGSILVDGRTGRACSGPLMDLVHQQWEIRGAASCAQELTGLEVMQQLAERHSVWERNTQGWRLVGGGRLGKSKGFESMMSLVSEHSVDIGRLGHVYGSIPHSLPETPAEAARLQSFVQHGYHSLRLNGAQNVRTSDQLPLSASPPRMQCTVAFVASSCGLPLPAADGLRDSLELSRVYASELAAFREKISALNSVSDSRMTVSVHGGEGYLPLALFQSGVGSRRLTPDASIRVPLAATTLVEFVGEMPVGSTQGRGPFALTTLCRNHKGQSAVPLSTAELHCTAPMLDLDPAAAASSTPAALDSLNKAGVRLAVGASAGAEGVNPTDPGGPTAASSEALGYRLRLSWKHTLAAASTGSDEVNVRAASRRDTTQPDKDIIYALSGASAEPPAIEMESGETVELARSDSLSGGVKAPPLDLTVSFVLGFHSDAARSAFVLGLQEAVAARYTDEADRSGTEARAAPGAAPHSIAPSLALSERLAAHARDQTMCHIEAAFLALLQPAAPALLERSTSSGEGKGSAEHAPLVLPTVPPLQLAQVSRLVAGLAGVRWIGCSAPGQRVTQRLPWVSEHSGQRPGDFVAPWPEVVLEGGDRVDAVQCLCVLSPCCTAVRFGGFGGSGGAFQCDLRRPMLSDAAFWGAVTALGAGESEDALEGDAVAAFDGLSALLGTSDPAAAEENGHVRAPALTPAWDRHEDTVVVFPSGRVARLNWNLGWAPVGLTEPVGAADKLVVRAYRAKAVLDATCGPELLSKAVAVSGAMAETRDRQAKSAAFQALGLVTEALPGGARNCTPGGVCTQPAHPSRLPSSHERMTAFRMHAESIGAHGAIHLQQSRLERALHVRDVVGDASTDAGAVRQHGDNSEAHVPSIDPPTSVEAARREVEQMERHRVLRWEGKDPVAFGELVVAGAAGREHYAVHCTGGSVQLGSIESQGASLHSSTIIPKGMLRELHRAATDCDLETLSRLICCSGTFGRQVWADSVSQAIDLLHGVLEEELHLSREAGAQAGELAWADEAPNVERLLVGERRCRSIAGAAEAGWIWHLTSAFVRAAAHIPAGGTTSSQLRIAASGLEAASEVVTTLMTAFSKKSESASARGFACVSLVAIRAIRGALWETDRKDGIELALRGLATMFSACTSAILLQLAGSVAQLEVSIRSLRGDSAEVVVGHLSERRAAIAGIGARLGAAGTPGGLTPGRRMLVHVVLQRMSLRIANAAGDADGRRASAREELAEESGGKKSALGDSAVEVERHLEHEGEAEEALTGLEWLAGDVAALGEMVSTVTAAAAPRPRIPSQHAASGAGASQDQGDKSGFSGLVEIGGSYLGQVAERDAVPGSAEASVWDGAAAEVQLGLADL